MEKDFIKICLKKWRWFVASVVVLLLGAIVFLLVVPPRYEREATLLIKDETSGSGILSAMTGGMGMLAGMAGLNISSNVLNEIEIMSAPATIEKVVEKMDIGTRYQAYDGLMKRDLWKETLPVKMTRPHFFLRISGRSRWSRMQELSTLALNIRKNSAGSKFPSPV